MLDVVVVGGGPAGSEVAQRLARSGYKVAVLEKRKKLGESFCCTGIVSLECVRRYDIPDRLLVREFDKARFFSPSGDFIELSYSKPLACLLDRPLLDSFLAHRACDAGADYRLAHVVKSLEIKNDGIVIRADSDGKELSVEARAVVLATGAGSKLAEMAGLGKAADPFIGVQCEVEATGLDSVEVYTGNQIAPGFFAWLVPSSRGKALLGLITRRNAKEYVDRFLFMLQEMGRITSDKTQIGFRPIAINAGMRTFGDRIVVVGGAAGQVKPATGGGIYYGLLCADIAAGVLESGLASDNLTGRYLAIYEREWKAVLGRELKFGGYARAFYERMTDEKIERLFKLVKLSGIEENISHIPDVSFDWHSKTFKAVLGHGFVPEIITKAATPFM